MSNVENSNLFDFFAAQNDLDKISREKLIYFIRKLFIKNLESIDKVERVTNFNEEYRDILSKIREEKRLHDIDLKILIQSLKNHLSKKEKDVFYFRDLISKIKI